MVQLSHLHMTTRKTIALTIWTFVGKVMSLLYDTVSRFVTAILPIWGLQSQSTLIVEPKKMKSDTVSTFSSFICNEVIRLDTMILVFECWVLSQLFHSPLSPLSRGSLASLHFLPLHLHIFTIWATRKAKPCEVSIKTTLKFVVLGNGLNGAAFLHAPFW